MSVSAVRTALSPAPPDEGLRMWRWTRSKYYRAAELGLFQPGQRLELLDGRIIEKMSPQRERHASGVLRTSRHLADAFGSGHHVRPQMPLILNDTSEPEPDLVVVPGTDEDYLASHPTAADARLVVEVADTTLRYDRGRKRAAYARAGIREYWILNLAQRQLEVYRDPSGSRYRTIAIYREEEIVTPLAAPHATLRVGDLLPPHTAAQSG